MNRLITYHGSHELKNEFVGRMKAHIEADEVVQGTGFEKGRGCAVGCTYDMYDHSLGPERLGLPEWYERLRDNIFEGIPENEAPQWALDSLEKVPVGVDLEPVRWKLAILRHERQLNMLSKNPNVYARHCEKAIAEVIDYCKLKLKGEDDEIKRRSAAESARSAGISASRSAAESAALSAARSAKVEAMLSHYQWERCTLTRLMGELGGNYD